MHAVTYAACQQRWLSIFGQNITLMIAAIIWQKRLGKHASQKVVNLFFDVLTTSVYKSENRFTVLWFLGYVLIGVIGGTDSGGV